MITIRKAVPADVDAVCALHTAARETYYRGRLREADYAGPAETARSREAWARAIAMGVVLCAEGDGEIVGVAASREVDAVMTLTQLHVHPARWSRGIGSALHAACADRWRRAGVRTARLEVFEHNQRAQDFYARQGWTPDPDKPRAGNHLVLRFDVPEAAE
ncbi:GNAT family N-acetyltransferase [Streptomyces sp. NPDC059169]|uniref:GNAT family N-acetyltransferase n=1 Tax=unclassified Streptomyces TaxID=2593676 RepID=UPI003675DE39